MSITHEGKTRYANAIARTYLEGAGFKNIMEGSNASEDFIVTQNGRINRTIVVDVKASKYDLSDIERKYKKLRSKYNRMSGPRVVMYINYENRTGYFEVLGRGVRQPIDKLNVPRLRSRLSRPTR